MPELSKTGLYKALEDIHRELFWMGEGEGQGEQNLFYVKLLVREEPDLRGISCGEDLCGWQIPDGSKRQCSWECTC